MPGFTFTAADLEAMARDAVSLKPCLAFMIRREKEYPSRLALQRRLQKIADAARPGRRPAARQLILDELSDLRIWGLLANGDRMIPEREIRSRAMRVLQRSSRRGRGKLYPDPAAAPDALECCALIVSMIWRKTTGDWPGAANPRAHEFCELLWLAAGSNPKQHQTTAARPGTVTAWRKHLVTARRYRPPHAVGQVVARGFAGNPPKRRPPLTEEQSRRLRACWDNPRSIAAGISLNPPSKQTYRPELRGL
jgi:hypothetical protein